MSVTVQPAISQRFQLLDACRNVLWIENRHVLYGFDALKTLLPIELTNSL